MLNDAQPNHAPSNDEWPKGRYGRRAEESAGAMPGGSLHIWRVLAIAIAMVGGAPAGLFAPAIAVAAEAQTASAQIPQEKLDSLLAPIALYPDQLLTQTLMAATYPLDVVAAARFVQENKDLKGDALDKAIVGKNWDPSVQSLAAYPQVLLMMNDKLDWTQELGEAFLTDEKRVMNTVQSLRQKAYAEGNLKSNEQQKVIKQDTVIIVEPAAQVVYVPTYNPTVVYGSWWAPSYPPYYYPPPPAYYPGYSAGTVAMAGLIGFGIGVAVADNHWGWSNCNWGGGDVDINVNRNNSFVNNNAEFKNKVNNGKWNHNPAQRKGVGYNNPRTREQFRKSDPGAVSSRRDARGYGPRDGRDGGGLRNSSGGANNGLRQRDQSGVADRSQRNGVGDRGGRDSSGFGDRGGRDSSGVGNRASGRDNSYGDRAGVSDRSSRSSRSSRGEGAGGRSSPSFDSRQSRQQTRDFSSRGASSRSQMGGSRGGGSRGGGGRR